jgi:4-amino-4-deoxy-L-arabinose transferase-like glycosyltransferase
MLGAVAGGVLVFATFSLARLVLPVLPSLAATVAAAATPLFTVHARIFKEDIFVAAFLVLALTALIRLLQEPAPHRAILLGFLAGLAAGSKYIGVLVLLFAVVAILVVPTPGPERRLPRVATVTGVSIGTFLLIIE